MTGRNKDSLKDIQKKYFYPILKDKGLKFDLSHLDKKCVWPPSCS